MNETPPSPAPRDAAIENAAAEWLVSQDRGLTPAQQDAFLAWLGSSAVHREAFERHRRLWREFDALSHWRPEHAAAPNPDLLAPPRQRRIWRWAALGASLAAAATVALVFRPRAAPTIAAETTLAFEAAGYRQETLPDGSTLDLNRGAHAVVRFMAGERRVLLLEGEAQFTVARDTARPFVVRAGGVEVRAIGTAFNVKLATNGIEVLVTAGVVHLSPAVSRERPAPMPLPVLAALVAGQRTVVPLNAPPAVLPVTDVAPSEIERLLEWQPRFLDFDATALAQVVEVFNRRSTVRLVIADSSLNGLPIVASIRSDNIDGFVRLLEATMGIRAEHRGSEILLQAK